VTRFQQCLAGDTANSQTGASELRILINASGVNTELGGSDRSDVTCGAATEDDKIMSNGFHFIPSGKKVNASLNQGG
jgi:hypothetical protein